MSLLKTIRFKSINDLSDHIKTHKPTLYISSQTSTVIPYDKLDEYLKIDSEFYLGDLAGIPPKMELRANDLFIEGAVNWKDARAFLLANNRDIKTSPTEELALISAGVATSCTGERCFKFGNLRNQIKECSYINYNGDEVTLSRDKDLSDFDGLKDYQNDFAHYQDYKNAPYPRFEKETDLMIGSEGQLGIVTNVLIETTEKEPLQHLFITLPKWEDNYDAHIEIANKVQSFRDDLFLVELIDSNAFNYLKAEDRPAENKDIIFFEIKANSFERFYSDFIENLENVSQDQIFELNETKFQQIRKNTPRAVFEENSRQNVVKVGTDVQVSIDQLPELLDLYKSFTKIGIDYNLFGHFGDAHLHFNFMPISSDVSRCQSELERMYSKVLEWKGSPFAEHGIGLIKKKYIAPFYGKKQRIVFSHLKHVHDPHLQFFPQGFMNSKECYE